MKHLIFILLFSAAELFSQSYTVDTVISNLDKPIAFAFLPDGNVIVTHKDGPVKIYSLNNTIVSTVWNFSDSCVIDGERGVLGVCIDPLYNVNRLVYIYYVHAFPPSPLNPQRLRVVRLTMNINNTGVNPAIIFDHPVGVIGCCHVGGNIHFGHDNKLYITIGETNNQPASQSRTTPLGKILRINSNGTAPSDNPFYDDGNPYTGNDDRIWCMGLRNSFDFCFSPFNDSLYAAENGLNTSDEVNFIRKGKNYGWPICEGYCSPYIDSLKQPMHVWSPTVAVTGILIYRGSIFPELNGKLLAADYNNGKIYKLELGNAPFYDTVTSRTEILDLDPLTSLKQGSDGYIYALDGGYVTNGKLYRVKPSNIGVNNNQQNVPNGFMLYQNYPNPFNPTTKIKFDIISQHSPLEGGTGGDNVKLTIYNPQGKEITVLLNKHLLPGTYEAEWRADNFPSGVYFYKLTYGEKSIEKKMVLIK